MKTDRRAFLKQINWVLAGILGMLGFAGCDIVGGKEEYGTPYADYTVKGAVVNKATGKPIAGIRVGYDSVYWTAPAYGVIPTPYNYKPKAHVMANSKGEFKLTERSYNLQEGTNGKILVFVDDIDGKKNGLFQSETLLVDFGNAKRSGKQKNWYHGEYTVNVNVELTEIENK